MRATVASYRVGRMSDQLIPRLQPEQGGNVSPLLSAISFLHPQSPFQMPDCGHFVPV